MESINSDNLIREFLEANPTKLSIEDGDETFFRFWEDDGLKIRSCLECSGSQFKSPTDGVWIIYWTPEHHVWICNQYLKEDCNADCSLCEKWFYRWRKSDHHRADIK